MLWALKIGLGLLALCTAALLVIVVAAQFGLLSDPNPNPSGPILFGNDLSLCLFYRLWCRSMVLAKSARC